MNTILIILLAVCIVAIAIQLPSYFRLKKEKEKLTKELEQLRKEILNDKDKP